MPDAEIRYRLTFEGGEADYNRLPAHDGTQSLEGFTFSLALISHYLATGEIRYRGKLSPKIRVFIKPPRQGSFITDIYLFVIQPENLFITSLAGAYALNTTTSIINNFIVGTLRGVCGLAVNFVKRDESIFSRMGSGDREALMDRIEPSMGRAHEVIGQGGADRFTMKKGQTQLAVFDHKTKAYVRENIPGQTGTRTAGVGAFNANTGNGRLYLPDIGKTVPFSVSRASAMPGTFPVLTFSLDRYARNLPSEILVNCSEVLSIDGRIKKLEVHGASRIDA